jgi:plasmid replication initiation protein
MTEKNIVIQKEKVFVNAMYKLTLDEQRLFHYAVAKVNPLKHRYGQYYLIEIKKVIRFFGLESNKRIYEQFYNAIETLFNRQCTYFSEELQRNVTCRLIVDKINDNIGVVGLRFSDQVAGLISHNKDFLRYRLAQTVNITSPNANRLYEILLQPLQRCSINKLTKNIYINELKELMGLTKNYPRFNDFNKRVLEVSRKQINKHTDITISYTVIKKGRTPDELQFTAKYSKGKEPTEEDQAEIQYPDDAPTAHEYSEPTDEQRAKRKADLKSLLTPELKL